MLSAPLALASFIVLGLSLFDQDAFFVVYNTSEAYLLLWIAYVPSGQIRRFNRFGDYSYGTYIYAFPIQQAAAFLIPGISVPGMVLVSSVATLTFAVASWHMIERRALDLKASFRPSLRR